MLYSVLKCHAVIHMLMSSELILVVREATLYLEVLLLFFQEDPT